MFGFNSFFEREIFRRHFPNHYPQNQNQNHEDFLGALFSSNILFNFQFNSLNLLSFLLKKKESRRLKYSKRRRGTERKEEKKDASWEKYKRRRRKNQKLFQEIQNLNKDYRLVWDHKRPECNLFEKFSENFEKGVDKVR